MARPKASAEGGNGRKSLSNSISKSLSIHSLKTTMSDLINKFAHRSDSSKESCHSARGSKTTGGINSVSASPVKGSATKAQCPGLDIENPFNAGNSPGPDFWKALELINVTSITDFEQRFINNEAFLIPWADFRDSFLLLQPNGMPRISLPGRITRERILWWYTQYDDDEYRCDPNAPETLEVSPAATPRGSSHLVLKPRGPVDKTAWGIDEYEKHLYVRLLQAFRVGKKDPIGFVYFRHRNVCSAWADVFVPIVHTVIEQYDMRGRRYYGRLALFIEDCKPSRLAFPEANVGESSKHFQGLQSVRQTEHHTVNNYRKIVEVEQKRLWEEDEKELRQTFAQYGGLVEKPKINIKKWIEDQRVIAHRHKARIMLENEIDGMLLKTGGLGPDREGEYDLIRPPGKNLKVSAPPELMETSRRSVKGKGKAAAFPPNASQKPLSSSERSLNDSNPKPTPQRHASKPSLDKPLPVTPRGAVLNEIPPLPRISTPMSDTNVSPEASRLTQSHEQMGPHSMNFRISKENIRAALGFDSDSEDEEIIETVSPIMPVKQASKSSRGSAPLLGTSVLPSIYRHPSLSNSRAYQRAQASFPKRVQSLVPEHSQVFPETVQPYVTPEDTKRVEKNGGLRVPELPPRVKKDVQPREAKIPEQIEMEDLKRTRPTQFQQLKLAKESGTELIDQPKRVEEPKYKSKSPAALDLSLPGARPGAPNDPLRHRLPQVIRPNLESQTAEPVRNVSPGIKREKSKKSSGSRSPREHPSQIPLPSRRVQGLRYGSGEGKKPGQKDDNESRYI